MARTRLRASIERMILHEFRPVRRLRLPLAAILAASALVTVGGCSREVSHGVQRLPTPSMAETEGHDLLFTDSRDYVWADNR